MFIEKKKSTKIRLRSSCIIVHVVDPVILYEHIKLQTTNKILPHIIIKGILIFVLSTLMCIEATQYFPKFCEKNTHRQITLVRFEPTTFALLEQMSYSSPLETELKLNVMYL